MLPNGRIAEYVNLEYGIPPTDIGGTTTNTGWIPMANYPNIACVVQTAADYTDATCVVTAQQAKDAASTGAKAIAGLTITLNAASEIGIVELKSEDLDVNNDFDWVKFIVTEAANNGANYVSAQVVATTSRYKDDDLYDAFDESDYL